VEDPGSGRKGLMDLFHAQDFRVFREACIYLGRVGPVSETSGLITWADSCVAVTPAASTVVISPLQASLNCVMLVLAW